MSIEDEIRAALEEAHAELDPKHGLPHQHTATVEIRFDKDGDAQLNRPLEAWLKRRKGNWGVHYFGEGMERRATFMFELEADQKEITQWLK